MAEQDAEPESPVRSQRETVTCLPEVTSPGWRDGKGGITPENPSSTQKCHLPILLVDEGFLSPDWYENKKEVNGSGKVTHNHRPTRAWAVISPPETGRCLYHREARSRPVTCHSELGLPHARRPGPQNPVAPCLQHSRPRSAQRSLLPSPPFSSTPSQILSHLIEGAFPGIMKYRCFPDNLPSNSREKPTLLFPDLPLLPAQMENIEASSSPSSSGDVGTIFISISVPGRSQVHVQKLLSIPATPPLHEAASTQRKLLTIWL